jgi:hypothetical protein
MFEPYQGVLFIGLMALAFGGVILLGTTLVYFGDKHRRDKPETEVRELRSTREEEPVSVDAGSAEHDRAA